MQREYSSPLLLKNGHVQTILSNLLRKSSDIDYARERIDTPDGDFLDLDWLYGANGRNIVILSHGLEGSSSSSYIHSLALKLQALGYSVVAWNYRGCSGETNKKLYTYHTGKSEDLKCVVNYLLNKKDVQSIHLIGISAGGNITLKYLGECAEQVPKEVKSAAVLSAPCDLEGSSQELAERKNWIYMKRFLIYLYHKLKAKKELYPDLDLTNYSQLKNFYDYDNRYTAPQNGYKDCYEYWTANNSLQFLEEVTVPTLMISAYDDPFLSPTCYPKPKNSNIKTLYTTHGGHVAHMNDYIGRSYWYENVVVDSIQIY